jgi:hypothetical protein
MARAAGTYMYSQGCIVQSSSLQNLLGTAVHWAGNLQQTKRTRSAESALWRQVSGGAAYSRHTNPPPDGCLGPNHARPATFVINSSMMQLVIRCVEAGLRPS